MLYRPSGLRTAWQAAGEIIVAGDWEGRAGDDFDDLIPQHSLGRWRQSGRGDIAAAGGVSAAKHPDRPACASLQLQACGLGRGAGSAVPRAQGVGR